MNRNPTDLHIVPLRYARARLQLTQEEMGKKLGISRKTYTLFETRRWFPAPRERRHFVKALHELDPVAADALARAMGESLADHVAVSPPSHAPSLDPQRAKLAFDASLYATAEELDVTPRALRAIAAALLGRLAETGLTMAQAVELARPKEPREKNTKEGREKKTP